MKKINLKLFVMMFVSAIFVGCNNDDNDPIVGAPTLLSAEVKGMCVVNTEVDEPNSQIIYYVPMYTPTSEFTKCKLEVNLKDATLSSESENVDLTNGEVKITIVGSESKEYTVKRMVVNVDNATPSIVSKYKGTWSTNVNGVKEGDDLTKPVLYLEHTAPNIIKMTLNDFVMGDNTFLSIVSDNIYLYDKKDSIGISGMVTKTLTISKVKTEVEIDIRGVYYVATKKIKLSFAVSGVEGKDIITTFEGDVFSAPNDVEPLFISVKGAKVLSQTFSQGDVIYYGDINNDPAVYKDMTVEVKLPEGTDWKNPMTGNKEFDFTKKEQYIMIFSESDASNTVAHSIKRIEIDPNFPTEFDFTEWIEKKQTAPITSYFNPKGWETSNQAVATIKSMNDQLYPKDGEYPVTPDELGKVSKGVKIMTVDTKGGTIMGIASPKVTSGSMYLGTFELMAAMSNPLLATKFGVSYSGKIPTKVKMWYKYTPGTTYYDGLAEMDGVVDAPSVAVVLYDVTDDMKVTLTGVDIFDSPRIVAKGIGYPTKSADFKEFSVSVKLVSGKTYNTTTNKYKLAIILSSSKDGATFKGAPGSTFIVDELKLVTE